MKVKKSTLLEFRIFMTLCFTLSTTWLLYFYGLESFFKYLSYNSYLFILAYFFLGICTLRDGRYKRVHQVIASITHPITCIVTLLYWSLIFQYAVGTSPAHNVTSIYGHIFNLLPLLDLFISNDTLEWRDVWIPILVTLVYDVYVYYVHIVQGKVIYQFITRHVWREGRVDYWNILGFVVLGEVMVVFFYWVSRGVVKLRERTNTLVSTDINDMENTDMV